MNDNERELDYCFGDNLPTPGAAFPVAPGIRWVRMALPFALDHINVWLIEERETEVAGEPVGPGWTIIDCGIADDDTRARWEQVFDNVLGDGLVTRVLCTHCHPDHFGLANWLCDGGDKQRWQARLWMTLGEYTTGRLYASVDTGSGAGGDAAASHMVRHGFNDEQALEQIRHKAGYYPRLVPAVPSRFKRMTGGDDIRIGGADWRVIPGYGHSPEHAALYGAAHRILIAGDMVLPRISTNVSVFDMEPEGDPLGGFLTSLDRYDALPEDTLVLPSHGKPFRGLHTRLRQLRDHHAARLLEVEEACSKSAQSAASIVPLMFRRPLDTHQTTFAIGEALAHLHYLWYRNSLRRVLDDDGVYRFSKR